MSTSSSGLESLPAEVLQSIFSYVDPETLILIQRTSKRLKSVADEPLLWRNNCEACYRYWEHQDEHDLNLKRPAREVDWQDCFRRRKRQDVQIMRDMNLILASQTGRVAAFKRIAPFGLDAKDALLSGITQDVEEADHLARSWWSRSVLDHIHRRSALDYWTRLARFPDDKTLSLERALIAFDVLATGTRVGGFAEVTSALDEIAESFKQEHPQLDDLSTRKKALELLAFIRRRGFTGIDEEESNYHSMPHNFLGQAVLDPSHQTLPLVLVCLVSCIGTRLGIHISATNIPMHCFGVVLAPPGQDLNGKPHEADTPDRMFIDPYRHAEEVTPAFIETHLSDLGHTFQTNPEYMEPATVQEVVMRMTRNIIISHQTATGYPGLAQPDGETTISQQDAMYAALWAIFILLVEDQDGDPVDVTITVARGRHRIVPFLQEAISSRLPWDVVFLEEYVLPIMVPWYSSQRGTQLASNHRAMRANLEHFSEVKSTHTKLKRVIQDIYLDDAAEKTPKRRANPIPQAASSPSSPSTANVTVGEPDGNGKIKYKIGSVIRHRRYHYEGMIIGWDPGCLKGEDWISQMGVDNLPGGRGQNFYNVIASDGSGRYVAEENIEIVTQRPSPALMSQAGQWFKRWNQDQSVFVSNIEDEYPDS